MHVWLWPVRGCCASLRNRPSTSGWGGASNQPGLPATRSENEFHECKERLAGRRVLLVEDAAESRTLVAAALEQLGVKVDLAADGADAVRAAAANRYDAILMDIAMPGTDGFEAARRIRVCERGREEEPGSGRRWHEGNSAASSPSPLAGEGGSRSEPGEGKAICEEQLTPHPAAFGSDPLPRGEG